MHCCNPTLCSFKQLYYHTGCGARSLKLATWHFWQAFVALFRCKAGAFLIAALVLLAALFFLSGCNFAKKTKPAEHAQPSQFGQASAAQSAADNAINAADNATNKVEQKTAERDAKIKANVDAARNANQANIGTPAGKITDGELSVAQKRLEGVNSDQVEAQEAKKRAALIESGKYEEAKQSYEDASKSALKLAQDLGCAQKEKELAINERDIARANERAAVDAYRKQAEENKKEMERLLAELNKKHQQELDEARNEIMRDQVRNLNIWGGSCMGVALAAIGLAVGFGGIKGIRVIGPVAAMAGVTGLICFGLAQIVGQWWFKWACLVAILGILTWIAVWAVKHYRQGNLKTEAEAKADQLNTTLKTVIPVLDEAWDNADATIQTWLKQNIFSKLSKKMNTEEKSVIHTVRAELQNPQ